MLPVGFKRAFLKQRTLSDGTFIPKGAHTLMAIQPHQQRDPSIPDPEVFDGLRYYRMRQQEGHGNKHQFATTDIHAAFWSWQIRMSREISGIKRNQAPPWSATS